MPEMQMPDLKERLEVLAARGPTRGADDVFAAASAALDTGDAAGTIRRPRRRIMVPVVAAAAVVALAVSALVWLRDGGTAPEVRITPASSDLRDLYDTSDQAPLGDPLYLVPGYVPEGLTPFRVQGGDRPGESTGRGGSPFTERRLLFVKFDAAGTRPVASFHVEWGPSTEPHDFPFTEEMRGRYQQQLDDPLAGIRDQAVPDQVRGRDAFYVEAWLALSWAEDPWKIVTVSSVDGSEHLTVDELHLVAEGLEPRADGGFDVTQMPAGYVQVADSPGMASMGTNEREVVYRSGDGRAFRVMIVDDTEMTPGANLTLFASGPDGEHDIRLTEIRGRHAVLGRAFNGTGGFDQQTMFLQAADRHVQWLEPANVMVTVSGLGLTEDDVLAIANGLQVVDRAGWEQLLVQAPGRIAAPPEVGSPVEPEPVLEGDELAAADAFRAWLSPGEVEDAVAIIEDGESLRPALEEARSHADPASTYSAYIHSVRLVDPDHAIVIYSILRDGSPLLSNQQGVAVRIDGRWLVSRASYCALVAMGGTECPVA